MHYSEHSIITWPHICVEGRKNSTACQNPEVQEARGAPVSPLCKSCDRSCEHLVIKCVEMWGKPDLLIGPWKIEVS